GHHLCFRRTPSGAARHLPRAGEGCFSFPPMTFDLYLAFIAATVVLILIPGPNVALIVANSVAHGPRAGLLTVAGTGSAMVLQLALTVLGMSTLLLVLADWFELLRWAGVAYLLWIGLQAWRSPAIDLTRTSAP